MRFIVPKNFRNCGASYGLEHPYVFGQAGPGMRGAVWHRGTGEVVWWQGDTGETPGVACFRLNNLKHTAQFFQDAVG